MAPSARTKMTTASPFSVPLLAYTFSMCSAPGPCAQLICTQQASKQWIGVGRPEVHTADCMWQTMTAARPLGKVADEDQVFPAYSRRGLRASQQMTPGACLFARWLQAHDMPAASLGSRLTTCLQPPLVAGSNID